jgi:DNA-directed RNA polymerase specialized sigma24 family protein
MDASTLSDSELARRIAAAAPGEASEAEGELYARLAPRVRLYGLRHLRDAQWAADLTQQVLLMTIERLRDGKIHEPERLASYVLGMCRMVVLDLQRGGRRRERCVSSPATCRSGRRRRSRASMTSASASAWPAWPSASAPCSC